MNESTRTKDVTDFELVPDPPGELEEEMMLTVLERLEVPKQRQPLQCVTFKMPLHEYSRLKASTKRWKLQYSDVIRITLRKLIVVLESPSGEVLESLEQHREAQLKRARLREVAKRGKVVVPSPQAPLFDYDPTTSPDARP